MQKEEKEEKEEKEDSFSYLFSFLIENFRCTPNLVLQGGVS